MQRDHASSESTQMRARIEKSGRGALGLARRSRLRAAPIALAVLAIGSGAAYAATRSTATSIGTGVVVIDTNLAYQGAAAAGTGIVLSSSGEILTNNHVISGATTVRVVVPHTTRSYSARVLGYDRTADVALLQLQNASNLRTASLGDSSSLTRGTRVTAVGNAGGTGTLVSATGTVTGLGRSITVQTDNGSTQRLTGLIETNAALQPGDSGGPLFDGSHHVVGMDTAASTRYGFADYSNDGFAIPIERALSIANEIAAGHSSATVHVGGTAFLGVQVADASSDSYGYGYGGSAATNGAEIVEVVPRGAADAAGLAPGDVITAVNGRSVSSAGKLGPIVLALQPGTRINVAYTDGNGQSQSTTVTLASGPPQ
jgi:S1-C subfamily serine protease